MKVRKLFEEKIDWKSAMIKNLDPYRKKEEQHCTRCNELLKPENLIYLELNAHTGKYHAPGDKLPENISQGYFPFGLSCAKRVIEKLNGKCDFFQGIRK